MYRKNDLNYTDKVSDILGTVKDTNMMVRHNHILTPVFDLIKWTVTGAMGASVVVFLIMSIERCNLKSVQECAYKCSKISSKKGSPYRVMLINESRRGCWCRSDNKSETILPEEN